MTQCFVCHIFKNNIFIRATAGKYKFFCILYMLRIHTTLKKCSKRNVFDLHLQKMNPFGIHEPCIKIARSEVLFEQYIMDLGQEKYDIEV